MSTKHHLLPALMACATFGLSLASAHHAWAESRLDVDAPAGIDDLHDWDRVTEGILQAAEELRGFDAPLGPDVAGRTIGQYVDEWIMTPEVQAQLATLKEQALRQRAAGDKPGLDATLAEANRIVQVQIYRATVLGNYGVARDGMRQHTLLINSLVRRLPAAERAAAEPTLDGPARQLRTSVVSDLLLAEPPVDYADDSLRRYEILGVEPINSERVRIAWMVGDSERARGLPARGRDRQSKCPEPAAKASGSDRPSIDRSSLSALPYPVASQKLNYSGKVELALHVAASGCVTRIEIYHSVGVDELDDAALAWGETVRYLPAEKDGQAVDATQVVSVTFKLAD